MEIPAPLSECAKKALYRLSMGDLTCEAMTDYLSDPRRKNTGFSRDVAERTVALLRDQGFLDDKRFFLRYLKQLDEKLLGPAMIRKELIRRQFPRSYIQAALERRISYEKRALRLILKKAQVKELAGTPAGRKKLVDCLVRQGYDYTTANTAVSYVSEEGETLFSE